MPKCHNCETTNEELTYNTWEDCGEEFDLCENCVDDYEQGNYCEYDGQPSEYEEWQDFYGGDDWDHGQYDCDDW